jgi:hypothetical protein
VGDRVVGALVGGRVGALVGGSDVGISVVGCSVVGNADVGFNVVGLSEEGVIVVGLREEGGLLPCSKLGDMDVGVFVEGVMEVGGVVPLPSEDGELVLGVMDVGKLDDGGVELGGMVSCPVVGAALVGKYVDGGWSMHSPNDFVSVDWKVPPVAIELPFIRISYEPDPWPQHIPSPKESVIVKSYAPFGRQYLFECMVFVALYTGLLMMVPSSHLLVRVHAVSVGYSSVAILISMSIPSRQTGAVGCTVGNGVGVRVGVRVGFRVGFRVGVEGVVHDVPKDFVSIDWKVPPLATGLPFIRTS